MQKTEGKLRYHSSAHPGRGLVIFIPVDVAREFNKEYVEVVTDRMVSYGKCSVRSDERIGYITVTQDVAKKHYTEEELKNGHRTHIEIRKKEVVGG